MEAETRQVKPDELSTSSAVEDAPAGGDGEKEQEKAKSKRIRPRRKKLYADIRTQMEFYFSDANITKNRMMNEMVKKSEYADLKEFLGFNRIAALTTSVEELQKALKLSEKLVLSEDGSGVKRKIKFDETRLKDEKTIEKCTIYVENIPRNVGHEWVEKIFEEFGSIAYISLPKFSKSGQRKGFGFIEFDDEESAQRCLEAYGSMGACLPSSIDPAELQSVKTFDENSQQVSSHLPGEDDVDEEKKSGSGGLSDKQALKRELDEIDHSNSSSSTPDDTRKPKRQKTDESIATLAQSQSKEKPQKRQHEVIEDAGAESPDELVKPSKQQKVEDGSSSSEESSSSEIRGKNGSDQIEKGKQTKKKKRNRKKKKNGNFKRTEDKLETESIQLRILSKKHWRQLRNRFLNLQRENMSKLKKQLRRRSCRPQPPENIAVGGKSICLKIQLKQPAESVENFKSQINGLAPKDWSNFLQFIDYDEGASDSVVRFDGGPHAMIGINMFVQNCRGLFEEMAIMTEEETKNYWKSVKSKGKQNHSAAKIRGKDRLANQAMKAATHIRFDDDEEEVRQESVKGEDEEDE